MILCSGETPREVVATLRWISGCVCDRTYMTDPSSQCAVSRIWPNLCFSLCGIVLSWCYSDIPSQIGSLLCKVRLLSCQTVFPIFWILRIPLITQTTCILCWQAALHDLQRANPLSMGRAWGRVECHLQHTIAMNHQHRCEVQKPTVFLFIYTCAMDKTLVIFP